eukprot:2957578-Lingulodinium_polyedra.AAC.1
MGLSRAERPCVPTQQPARSEPSSCEPCARGLRNERRLRTLRTQPTRGHSLAPRRKFSCGRGEAAGGGRAFARTRVVVCRKRVSVARSKQPCGRAV